MLPAPMRDGVRFTTRWMRADNNLGASTVLFCFVLFQEVDQWSFDVFAFHKATGDHALKFLVYDLLTRYDLINRFRVHTALLSSQRSLKSWIRLRSGFTPALCSPLQLKEVVLVRYLVNGRDPHRHQSQEATFSSLIPTCTVKQAILLPW